MEYHQLRGEGPHGEAEEIILAAERVAAVLGEKAAHYEVVRRIPGSELVGLEYEPLYSFTRWKGLMHRLSPQIL